MLRHFPPMGVYETLFAFAAATDTYMGEPGTRPWAQGFPLTKQLPGGPPLPETIELGWSDLKYPKATGHAELRQAIADYYNEFYDAGIDSGNVAVFAGGRPAIFAILTFLEADVEILVEETEYTPYWDMLQLLGRGHRLIPSDVDNGFAPTGEDYELPLIEGLERQFLVKSNPCNPTGRATVGEDLRDLVGRFSGEGRGALFDEAYELFTDPEPDSAIRYVDDLEESNVFVVGAATKGLQVPGMRVGWVVASRRWVEIFRNWSSIGMGGVSRPAQIYVTGLLEIERMRRARTAVRDFFSGQRDRYADAFEDLGLELFTGRGGFYHWAKLPEGLTADELNRRLFEHRAGILPGRLCDMERRGGVDGPLAGMMRFSFGPLEPDSLDEDVEILGRCLAGR